MEHVKIKFPLDFLHIRINVIPQDSLYPWVWELVHNKNLHDEKRTKGVKMAPSSARFALHYDRWMEVSEVSTYDHRTTAAEGCFALVVI